jgi:hypothetical protein
LLIWAIAIKQVEAHKLRTRVDKHLDRDIFGTAVDTDICTGAFRRVQNHPKTGTRGAALDRTI